MKEAPEREVIYPQIKTVLEEQLTADKAKELLGWEEESENIKFRDEYLLRDMKGTKIRCNNNVINRPIYLGNVERIRQDILRGNWKFNGETIIVGKTGYILNGQHQLVALILSHQEWEEHRGKWCNTWNEEPPSISKLVVFGVEEDDDTVNTMDTCKPRTLADVLYRSKFFADVVSSRDRRIVATMLQNAIRMLWYRTGASSDAFAPKQTHAESISFVERHPKLLECVRHIFEENGTSNAIGKYISPGFAAGLLYLMAACDTSEDGPYQVSDTPDESMLSFDAWEDACDFFVALAGGDVKLDAVRQAIAAVKDEEGGSIQACSAILIKAWSLYYAGKSITTKDVALEYVRDDDGFEYLAESPTVGGIDLGTPA